MKEIFSSYDEWKCDQVADETFRERYVHKDGIYADDDKYEEEYEYDAI